MIAIAIDGPAGAGKSSISRKVAEELGFVYVDTGALYRAIGFFALQNGIDPHDEETLRGRLPEIDVELRYEDGVQRILLNGRDVSESIRSPEMSMAASDVSALGSVRDFLLELQRKMAERYNVVMDGRDIGTVVLPGADVKIFLTASVEDRARRRYEEYLAKDEPVSYNDILEEMRRRDHNDSSRAIAPLKPAPDAVVLDTTGNERHQSIRLVLDLLKERGIA